MTSLYYVACVGCGKRFMSTHNEHGRLWCSVGCQYAEEDNIEGCEVLMVNLYMITVSGRETSGEFHFLEQDFESYPMSFYDRGLALRTISNIHIKRKGRYEKINLVTITLHPDGQISTLTEAQSFEQKEKV